MAKAASRKFQEEVEEWRKEFENEVLIEEPVEKPKTDPEKEKLKKFCCGLCDFRAMTSMGLKKHLNKQHPWKERGVDD